jgi:hypothetical protein
MHVRLTSQGEQQTAAAEVEEQQKCKGNLRHLDVTAAAAAGTIAEPALALVTLQQCDECLMQLAGFKT